MITVRKSDERGHFDFGWLNTYHTFSFGRYRDPAHMGFRSLRVINEDFVKPGQGFPAHPHENMEIITYVISGSLRHQDSMGNGSVIHPGEVQKMSAGTGITHSEANASDSETVHLLQIWIFPAQEGVEPSYEQKYFPPEDKRNRLRLIVSGDGRDGSVQINQDADVYAVLLDPEEQVEHVVGNGRGIWVQVVQGSVEMNSHFLKAGDGASVEGEPRAWLRAVESAEVLLFDLR